MRKRMARSVCQMCSRPARTKTWTAAAIPPAREISGRPVPRTVKVQKRLAEWLIHHGTYAYSGRPPGKKLVRWRPRLKMRPVPPPEPQHLRHLLELPIQRQLREQQAIGDEHFAVDARALQRADAIEAVDHVARGHVDDAAAHPHPAVCLAEGIERPRAPLQHLSGGANPPIERIRQDDLWMRIHRGNELLQPAWMPEVVIARPGEVFRVGISRPGGVERLVRIADQAKALRVARGTTRANRGPRTRARSPASRPSSSHRRAPARNR